MGKLWQLSQGNPKLKFSEKEQRGDKRKFLKNRPKSSPGLKNPKGLWRKWHYPLIRMAEWPNGQVMAILASSPKPTFSEKVHRSDQGKFF